MKYRKGFTLIELLVVVAIIGLLSSVVLVFLNSARVKTRNSARLSGINTLVSAFNLSLGDNNSLPIASHACVSETCYGGIAEFTANATVDAFLAPSLSQKPSDPAGGSRGYGGFVYTNPMNVLGVSGAYIEYTMERPGSCGLGTQTSFIYSHLIHCVFKLD